MPFNINNRFGIGGRIFIFIFEFVCNIWGMPERGKTDEEIQMDNLIYSETK